MSVIELSWTAKNGTNQYQLWDNIGTTLGPHGDSVMTINGAPICPVGSIWHFSPLSPDLFYQTKNETLVFLGALIIDHLFSTQRLRCICGFVNFVLLFSLFPLHAISSNLFCPCHPYHTDPAANALFEVVTTLHQVHLVVTSCISLQILVLGPHHPLWDNFGTTWRQVWDWDNLDSGGNP